MPRGVIYYCRETGLEDSRRPVCRLLHGGNAFISQRDSTGWHAYAGVFDPSLSAGAAYTMTLQIVQGETAVLSTGGIHRVSFTFDGMGTGAVGLGTRNSQASFQAVTAGVFTPTVLLLPVSESFFGGT